MQVSTGFKSLILGRNSFSDIFNGGAIKIYNNAQPPSPDIEDFGATVIGMITLNGQPWNFGSSTNGITFVLEGAYVYNNNAENWILTPSVSLEAAWFRLYSPVVGDVGQSSTEFARIDGTISELGSAIGADMYMADTALTVGSGLVANYFLYTILPIPTGD
jgi:hypothetical protein